VLDYSKYKYEQAQKVKQARKHQQQITVREIKFRPKIAQHDYDTKKHHVERFLKHKDKVKITIMFRGREVTHPERGVMILDRLAEELSELAVVEQRPMQDGRNMTMMLAPSKAILAGHLHEPNSTSGESDSMASEPDLTVSESDSTPIEPDSTPSESDSTPSKPDLTVSESDSTLGEPDEQDAAQESQAATGS
jgi:translation initiation factor IF-3